VLYTIRLQAVSESKNKTRRRRKKQKVVKKRMIYSTQIDVDGGEGDDEKNKKETSQTDRVYGIGTIVERTRRRRRKGLLLLLCDLESSGC
jgi:hypothetical protein